jgi:hypothetical protein
MSGRLFIHIGPPKTATTSLQLAWDELSDARYRSLGAMQPRERDAGSLSQRFLQSVSGELDSAGQERLTGDLDELSSFVASGGIALLSEEILSLNQPEAPFAEKIGRLRALIGRIPATILITLRDPVDALPSLYQEIYQFLPFALQLDFARFCKDDRTLCYDYPRIAEILAGAGFPDIGWLDFVDIAGGALSTTDIFGEFDIWEDRRLMVGESNVGIKSQDGHKRHLPKANLRGLGDYRAVQNIVDCLKLRGTGLMRWTSAAAQRINLRPEGLRKLTVPDEVARDRHTGYVAARSCMYARRPSPEASRIAHDRAD